MAPAWEVRRIVGWSYELGVQIELPPEDERARIDKYRDGGEEGSINDDLAGLLLEPGHGLCCVSLRSVELLHESGSSNVFDATYFRRSFTAVEGLSSGALGQKEAKSF